MRNFRFVIYSVLIAIIVVFTVMAESKGYIRNNSDSETIVLRYGDVNPDGNVTIDCARYFAEQVSTLSNGHIQIDIYPSGVLGDEVQSYKQLQMGALDMYRANSGSLGRVENMEVTILALPYIFRDRKHFWDVCNGTIGDEILDNIEESGSNMVGLFYMDEGMRNIFTTNEPVTRIEQFQGKKIRVMVSDILTDTFRALGAVPIESNYAQLYNTLSSGGVDGADNPVISYYTNKFYKPAPYYTETGHMYAPSVVIMSEITWNTLSDEDKKVIKEAAHATEEYNKNCIAEDEENAYDRLEKLGVSVNKVSDPENWREAVQPVYEKYGIGYEELIDRIRETE